MRNSCSWSLITGYRRVCDVLRLPTLSNFVEERGANRFQANRACPVHMILATVDKVHHRHTFTAVTYSLVRQP